MSVRFGGVRALDDVSFSVGPREVHCLAGENGSGKSTLIKVIAGVYQTAPGARTDYFGESVASPTPELARRKGVAVIWQDLALFPEMTVAENIAFDGLVGAPRLVNYRAIRETARAALAKLGVELTSARPRRVRQPSRSLSQIDDGRAVGAPQKFDHLRQLAAILRGGHPGRVAAFVRTGASLRLRLRHLTVLDRVLRSLVDGDGFQTGRRQFERVILSSVIAAPDRRSRFRTDLAGKTKLRKFGADFAESRALDRCRRRQATGLALCRGAHHHKLRVGKFDTHDPTVLSSWRSGRSGPHQDEPRIGRNRGAVGSFALLRRA